MKTGRGCGCAGEMHGAVAYHCHTECGNEWVWQLGVQSMKMPYSTCMRIGSRVEAKQRLVQLKGICTKVMYMYIISQRL